MQAPRPRPTRAQASFGLAVLHRWLVFALASAFLGVESLALAPVAHEVGGHGCTHCVPNDGSDGDGHGHEHTPGARNAPGESEAPDPDAGADGCALCRVLAAVPTPIALPPALPRPEVAPALPAGASATFVPACVLALGLARGPPAPTRR